MAESRKHGYHLTDKGHVEQVGPSGASILVRTKAGNVVNEQAGLALSTVVSGLKEGERLATPEDLLASWQKSKEVVDHSQPAPVIEGFTPKAKAVKA